MGKTISKKLQMIVSMQGAASAIQGIKKVAEAIFFIGNAAKMVKNAFISVGKSILGLIDDWGKQEAAIISVNSALKATGIFTPKLSVELQKLATDLQRVTTFGDETTLEMVSMLQSLGKLNADGLKKIIPSVLDFASGMKMDLFTAASLIGKTLGSTTNALSRYGMMIDATADKQTKITQLMASIEKSFGGRAASETESYSGLVIQLSNAWGDLKETIGRVLVTPVSEIFKRVKIVIEELTDKITNIGENVGWDVLADFMINKWELIIRAVSKLIFIYLKDGWNKFADWLEIEGLERIGNTIKRINPVRWIFPGDLNQKDKVDLGKTAKEIYSTLEQELIKFQKESLFAKSKSGKVEFTQNLIPQPEEISEAFIKRKDDIEKQIAEWSIKMDAEKERKWLPGEVSEDEWERILVKNKYGFDGLLSEYQNYLNKVQSTTQAAAGAYTALFDVIAINADSTEKRVLDALASITNAMPQVFSMMNQLKLGDITGADFGFGIVGIGHGVLGTLISLFSQNKEDAAAEQARQERQVRRYGTVSRATPMTVTIAPSTYVTGEVQILSQDGRIIAEAVNNLVLKSFKAQVDSGEISVAGMVGGVT